MRAATEERVVHPIGQRRQRPIESARVRTPPVVTREDQCEIAPRARVNTQVRLDERLVVVDEAGGKRVAVRDQHQNAEEYADEREPATAVRLQRCDAACGTSA